MPAHRTRTDDYRLTTAEIFYHSSEAPDALQSLIWQDYDHGPDYPELRKFLTYWSRHIDSVVHSVYVAAGSEGVDANNVTMPSSAIH